MILVVFFV